MVKITGTYTGELHCTARHEPSGAILATDAPRDNQGLGAAFSPTDLVATAFATCIATTMALMARKHGHELGPIRYEVTKEMTATPPRAIARLAATFWLPAEARAPGVRALTVSSPSVGTLRRAPPVRSLLSIVMSLFLRSTVLLGSALCAAALPAQTPPPTNEPLLLENLIVSGSPVARTQADLLSSTSVLAGTALLENQQPSLGETLAALPGVSSTYFGPGASRPILRGLGANRVRVLANSTDTLDASNTSPDHAVSVEPFLVKRIEVVRGPAALLYGSAAVGGVVNVIDHRIESELPAGPVAGTLDARATDNGAGYATGGSLDVALAPDRAAEAGFVLHLDGFQREADDLAVPGFSGQPGAPKGELLNTGVDSQGASAGLSYVSRSFDAGLNYNGFDTLYGVPNETGVKIDLRQRRLDGSADYTGDLGVFTGVRAKFGHADYQHREIEDGAVVTTVSNLGTDVRLELLQGEVLGWTGALGFQAAQGELSVVGDEAFLPTHTTASGAVFLFEELVRDHVTWQVGARVEHREIEADPFASPGGAAYAARSDDRTTFSGSFGAIYTLNPTYKLAWSLA